MLNNAYKEQAQKDLEKINNEYSKQFQKTLEDIKALHNVRIQAIRTIQYVEKYIVDLANKPRNFEIKVQEIQLRYVQFQDDCRKLQEIEREQISGKRTVGALGFLGGTGVAVLGPGTMMAVAMTFGTASTGTAIASLSGAAATNAALAWLGGGACAAGGAGILGGEALLGALGPIGWAIGGASLVGCLISLNLSNKEIAQKTENSIAVIKKEMTRIRRIDIKVLNLKKETILMSNKIMKGLNAIRMNRKKNYVLFSEEEINQLVSLLNVTEVLSKKISETLEYR